MTHDDNKCRVTLICACQADYAVGYGPTIESARAAVLAHWKRDKHRIKDIRRIIIEQAVPRSADKPQYGEHYVEVPDPSTGLLDPL